MTKTIVALLTLLLAFVAPAAAQDPEPSSEPQPSGDPSSSPEPEGEPEGEPQAEPQGEPQPSSQQSIRCRVAATHIGDPRISPNRWVIPDPDGCFRLLIERLIERLIGTTATDIIPRIL